MAAYNGAGAGVIARLKYNFRRLVASFHAVLESDSRGAEGGGHYPASHPGSGIRWQTCKFGQRDPLNNFSFGSEYRERPTASDSGASGRA